MSLLSPSLRDWGLKISERLNVTNSGFIKYVLLNTDFFYLRTLFWHVWYYNLVTMPQQAVNDGADETTQMLTRYSRNLIQSYSGE